MGALLVTGGAGYVGSHTVRELVGRGEDVVVLDDLSEGHRRAASDCAIVEQDLAAESAGGCLDALFAKHRFDAVLHFGAKAYVGESIDDPGKYYRNNVTGGLALLEAMARNDVSAIIFSSTCAIYGTPDEVPIREDHPKRPISPYGRTKLAFEWALADFDRAHALRHVSLRYFNASGAHESGELGEDHRPETHIIPLACEAALGRGAKLSVFGDDYDTPDGTCIRDYVHVQDLARAHVVALDHLRKGGDSRAYNVGTGTGYSVLDVIRTVERVSSRNVDYAVSERRPGDPARLVASSDKIRRELGWKPRWDALEPIVASAWSFKERYPDGYPDD